MCVCVYASKTKVYEIYFMGWAFWIIKLDNGLIRPWAFLFFLLLYGTRSYHRIHTPYRGNRSIYAHSECILNRNFISHGPLSVGLTVNESPSPHGTWIPRMFPRRLSQLGGSEYCDRPGTRSGKQILVHFLAIMSYLTIFLHSGASHLSSLVCWSSATRLLSLIRLGETMAFRGASPHTLP